MSSIVACMLADIFVSIVPAQGDLNMVNAYQEATEAVQQHCPGIVLTLNASKSRCARILKRNPMSEACFLVTDKGFFFVTHDLLDGSSITYNRWD
jgi:hypothetical protein